MEEKRKQSRAERLFCVAFFALAFYLIFKYALKIIFPFAIGYLLSVIISPISRAASKKLRCPQKLCAAFFVTALLALIGALSYFAVRRLFSELSSLIEKLGDPDSDIYISISAIVSRIGEIWEGSSVIDALENLTGSSDFRESLSSGALKFMTELAQSAAQRIPSYFSSLASAVPAFLISLIVSVMSCYYFSMDRQRITSGLLSLLPTESREGVVRAVSLVSYALRRYARAYLLLMAITFFEIFVGLMILGVRWAFIIAIIVAVVDILPVFGAGTVLIPWAVFSFVTGGSQLGIGLVVLYGVVTVIRQLCEPKIIGSSIGVHPIATLFSMYAGLRLFGVAGMILGPAAALVIKEIISGGGAQNISRT